MAQPPYASRFLRPHEKERLIDGVVLGESVESSFSAAEEREIHLSHAGAAVKRGQAQLAARAHARSRSACSAHNSLVARPFGSTGRDTLCAAYDLAGVDASGREDAGLFDGGGLGCFRLKEKARLT